MKRVWIWLALLAAAAALRLLPAQGTDAAELEPVQVVLIEAKGGRLRVETDRGSVGFGNTLDEALADLCAGAPGAVFLGTAEHIVVADRARYLLPGLAAGQSFRPSARAYCTAQLPDAAEAAEFLRAHPGALTLQRLRASLLYGREAEPPRLVRTEGGVRLA